MGLLKKFFNSKREAARSAWIERSPRIRVIPLHDIYFKCDAPVQSGTVPILNLSITGLGMVNEKTVAWPVVGSELKGSLQIGTDSFPVSGQVVYLADHIIGVRFLDGSEGLKGRILRYLVAEFSAVKMTEVKKEMLAAEGDGEPHFLVGQNQCELFYVQNKSAVVWFQLTFMGNYIECERDGKLREGIFEEENRKSYKGSTVIKSLRPLSSSMAELALKFVANIQNLDVMVKAQIDSRIEACLKELGSKDE